MKIKKFLVSGIAAFLIFISVNSIFSQEASEQRQALPEAQSNPEAQWVWGEVSDLDIQNKTISVKYLDYETDQTKEVSISIDDKTTYENINSIDELKPKDTVSIDYTISADGKNIAKNISVERPENTANTQEGNITEQKAPAAQEEEQNIAPAKTEEPKTMSY